MADAGLVRMQSSQERGPCRATSGGVVELGEADAVAGQGVEVRRVDLAAVTPDVRVSDVVAEEDDDVGSGKGGGGQGEAGNDGGDEDQADE